MLIHSSSALFVLVIIFLLNDNLIPVMSQLSGGERTMEQFLDSLLHSSVYDRRIRPYSNLESKIEKNIYQKLFKKLVLYKIDQLELI